MARTNLPIRVMWYSSITSSDRQLTFSFLSFCSLQQQADYIDIAQRGLTSYLIGGYVSVLNTLKMCATFRTVTP